MHFIRASLLVTLLLTGTAHAEIKPFELAGFEQKLKAGEAVVIAAHAPWCSTCRAQKPVLKQLSDAKPYQQLVIYEIDYDSQKLWLAKMNITRQSTLVAYKNGKEINRSIGATSPAAIESVLKSVE